MNINEGDLIKLRKDIERVRKHEESRKARQVDEKSVQPEPSSGRASSLREDAFSIAVRLRAVLEGLLKPAGPSDESLEAIPEHVVTLLQVIRDEPTFEKWILAIGVLAPALRNQQLQKMSFAFRIEDKNSTIAESFDRLQDSNLFKAFCQGLRDEKQASA